MGSYGIGLGRILASIIEQNNDEDGIIWPIIVAPYKVAIVIINSKDENQVKLATDLYEKLENIEIDVLLDDRDERPGVKFKDMDLIGIPVRITVGKKAEEGIFEWKLRSSKDITEVTIEEAITKVKELVQE